MYDDGAGRDDIVEGGKLLSVKFEWKKTFRHIGISEKVPIIFGHLWLGKNFEFNLLRLAK